MPASPHGLDHARADDYDVHLVVIVIPWLQSGGQAGRGLLERQEQCLSRSLVIIEQIRRKVFGFMLLFPAPDDNHDYFIIPDARRHIIVIHLHAPLQLKEEASAAGPEDPMMKKHVRTESKIL